MSAMAPCHNVHAEAAAGYDHEKDGPRFEKGAVVVYEAFTVGREASCRYGGESVVDSVIGRHAADYVDYSAHHCKGQLYFEKCRRVVLYSWKLAFLGRARGFRLHHVDGAASELGQKRHEYDDDSETSHPVCEASPK